MCVWFSSLSHTAPDDRLLLLLLIYANDREEGVKGGEELSGSAIRYPSPIGECVYAWVYVCALQRSPTHGRHRASHGNGAGDGVVVRFGTNVCHWCVAPLITAVQ